MAAIAQYEKSGAGVGGVGRDETIGSAAVGAEHVYVLQCMAGAQPVELLFEKMYATLVGQ